MKSELSEHDQLIKDLNARTMRLREEIEIRGNAVKDLFASNAELQSRLDAYESAVLPEEVREDLQWLQNFYGKLTADGARIAARACIKAMTNYERLARQKEASDAALRKLWHIMPKHVMTEVGSFKMKEYLKREYPDIWATIERLQEQSDDDDPTPWCHGCGAMTKAACKCGPLAPTR